MREEELRKAREKQKQLEEKQVRLSVELCGAVLCAVGRVMWCDVVWWWWSLQAEEAQRAKEEQECREHEEYLRLKEFMKVEEEGEGGEATEEDSQAMLQEFIDYIKVQRGEGRGGGGREIQCHEVNSQETNFWILWGRSSGN